MLVLALQVATAVIASTRGWGALPLYLLALAFFVGITLSSLFGLPPALLNLLSIIDVALVGAFIGMSIAGRRQATPEYQPPPRSLDDA